MRPIYNTDGELRGPKYWLSEPLTKSDLQMSPFVQSLSQNCFRPRVF